jgi:hypothetical protein
LSNTASKLLGVRPRDSKGSRFADVDPGADRSEVGIYQIRDGKTRGRKPFTPTRPDGARFSERTATGLAG